MFKKINQFELNNNDYNHAKNENTYATSVQRINKFVFFHGRNEADYLSEGLEKLPEELPEIRPC